MAFAGSHMHRGAKEQSPSGSASLGAVCCRRLAPEDGMGWAKLGCSTVHSSGVGSQIPLELFVVSRWRFSRGPWTLLRVGLSGCYSSGVTDL